jgi:hypothetical protein
MIIGAFERAVDERVDDFSIRAHVRYTSNSNNKTPRRMIERCIG